ncbi:hypothetical protein EKO23_19175 [Nocardioides guangzhouensis]|uniref:Uncharacterized protein n=1 Tax=Nocardioides guangzhouensis TaxID=2497878 RepID=A0A4Q4Z6H6_9ACTN|nr:hypothetical protein [Nocardioides guangzhouensis]RYP83420.1 hypothetical protein EKO23_19175 [Nocardioides guangzhouensis]
MTTERGLPDADPADVAEQQQDVTPDEDREVSDDDRGDLPWSADEGDVAEQRREVPAGDDDDFEG